VLTDRTLNDAVAGIGNALIAAGAGPPYPFVFRVVDLPVANALAFPGGQVLVTAKLIADAETPDELAGVLGHEIAHVERRHVTRQLAQDLGLGLAIALLLGDVGTTSTLAATYGSQLASLSYGRGQEAEADDAGVRRAHAAGFDPRGLDAFFKRLAAADAVDGPALLSSHPATEDRSAAIGALVQALGPAKPGVRPRLPAWEAVRAAARGSEESPRPKPSPAL
jgi:predicted Zn-dependent protease